MDDLRGIQDASLRRQLAEAEENLRLFEERKAEYVFGTDVPLQLVKEERRLREHIARLRAQLRRSAGSSVRENEALLVVSYLREAALAGLDMEQLPEDNLGAILECIVRQTIDRYCCHLSLEHEQVPSTEEFCRLLSYLGWYMFNVGITGCEAKKATAVVEEILNELHIDQYNGEQVLDWLAVTYWLRKTSRGAFEFRDSYIVNVFAAMELKQKLSTRGLGSVLLLGRTGDPGHKLADDLARWQQVIVPLAGMLPQNQTVELLDVLLEEGLVQLAGWCIAEGQPVPQPIVARVIHALLA